MMALTATLQGDRRPADLNFTKTMLDGGAAETAAIVDINGDGKLDIVCGEYWYANPGWKKTQFRELNFDNNYVDAFSDLALDVDGDGNIDIITATYFQKKLSWYRNPGKGVGKWVETVIDTANGWAGADRIMYVVGATRSEEFISIRKHAPDHFLLVPGVGAQGGSLQEVSRYGLNKDCGLLVNSSRSIIYASNGKDFAEKARGEALKLQQEMGALLESHEII